MPPEKQPAEACIACGACCSHLTLPIESDHHGLHRWLQLHGGKIIDFHGKSCVDLPIPCKELRGGRCRIHESRQRPELCHLAFCEKAAAAMGGELVWLEEDGG